MNDAPIVNTQFLTDLKRQRETIINHERISKEIGIEFTDKQAGYLAGMLRMCSMIIEQVDGIELSED